MADETLFTAVQISDLHFGATIAGSASPGDALLRVSSWFEGWLDHHRIGVRELYRFFLAPGTAAPSRSWSSAAT